MLSSITMNRAKHMHARVRRFFPRSLSGIVPSVISLSAATARVTRRRPVALQAVDERLQQAALAGAQAGRDLGPLTLLERGQTLHQRPGAVGHELGVFVAWAW